MTSFAGCRPGSIRWSVIAACVSRGERQRLALARALLRRPALLVLDEATSAVDAESEGRILDAIEALRGSITTILVSHRAAPLRRAEIVYQLSDGTIAPQLSAAE